MFGMLKARHFTTQLLTIATTPQSTLLTMTHKPTPR